MNESLVGQTFYYLTVETFAGSKDQARTWGCRCRCGNYTILRTSVLKSGRTKSCGCLFREFLETGRLNYRKHGKYKTPEYGAWAQMKSRCLNKKSRIYPSYGGRGIKICERWITFEQFFEDMGKRPSPDHSIERLNNNANYCPDNCCWATRKEQMRNRSVTAYVNWNGKLIALADLADRYQLNLRTVRSRLRSGWAVEKVFKTPARKYVRG